jgi:hypothetical protein
MALSACGPRPNGDSCGRDKECSTNVCDMAHHVCGAQPDGAACARDQDCTSGICGSTGACEEPLANGMTCARDQECSAKVCAGGTCGQVDGMPCSSAGACVSGQCIAGVCGLRQLGMSCTTDTDCATMFCSGGKCALKLPNGMSCTGNDACNSGYCNAGKCADLGANGSPCTVGSGCVSGACNGGVCTCQGYNSMVTSGSQCCSGLTTTDANNHVVCISSIDTPCTTRAQCDPALYCGASGCCVPPGVNPSTVDATIPSPGPGTCCSGAWDAQDNCTCVGAGAACTANKDCCSGTCKTGTNTCM